jgi:hypothetical protein
MRLNFQGSGESTTQCKLKKIYGLYYKPITIVNADSSVVNKLEISLIDNTRVVIYDRHMFIVQATYETDNKAPLPQ